MSLRAAIIAFAFLAGAAGPVSAQEATAPPAASELSPAHVELAREALSALIIDSGAFAEFVPMAFDMVMPYFRAVFQNTPFFDSLPPARQRALLAYLDNISVPGTEESLAGAPALIERFAPRMAALFSEDELADIVAFARTPQGVGVFREGMLSSISGFPPTLTPEQRAALEAFGETGGGRAWSERSAEFRQVLYELGRAITSAPNVSARFKRDLCAIAGPDCPAGWRIET